MAKALPFFLIFFLFPIAAWAIDVVEVRPPEFEDRIGRKNFVGALENTLKQTLAGDPLIAMLSGNRDANRRRLQLTLKIDDRFPEQEALMVRYLKGEQQRLLTLIYSPEPWFKGGSKAPELCQRMVGMVVHQLKAESQLIDAPKLHRDMSLNIASIDHHQGRLDVQLLQEESPASSWKRAPKELPSLPIAQRRQDSSAKKQVSELMNATPLVHRDPTVPDEVEEPTPKIPIDPFHGESTRRAFPPLPRLLTGGPHGLLMSPSPLRVEPGSHFVVKGRTAWIKETFHGKSGLDEFRWNGDLYATHLSIGTHLWKWVEIELETGWGVGESSVQMDVSARGVPGGTTFLGDTQLDSGPLDTTLAIGTTFETRYVDFHPLFQIKFPTGRETDLLGSGEEDIAYGMELVSRLGTWKSSTFLSVVRPGDLNIFVGGALPLKSYLSLRQGFSREIDILGFRQFALAGHYQESAFRGLTDIGDLDQALGAFSMLLERPIDKRLTFRIEGQIKATSSAPDGALSLGIERVMSR